MLNLAVSLCLFLQQPQVQPQLKPQPSKAEETKKYHTPDVVGMPASVRLAGYEQRLQMERDSFFLGTPWRSVGPEIQSGRVVDFEWASGDPSAFYVAFATGGLYRTRDEGIKWESLFDGQSAYAIGDVAVSKDGKTIWVGTGENNSQRTSYSGTGVFKSSDGGKTWTNTGLAETHRIGRIVIDPKNENTVYVAAIGSLYSVNKERGVYKTTDGGKTWQHILKIDEHTGVIDLAMSPSNPNLLIASAWDRDRRAWNFRESGPGSAIYRSTDAGRTWTKVDKGIPTGDPVGRVGLAFAPSQPKTVYAFFDNQGSEEDAIDYDERIPSGRLTNRRFLWLTEKTFVELDKDAIDGFLRVNLRDWKTDETIQKVKDGTLKLADIRAEIEKRNPNAFLAPQADAQVFRSDDEGKTWHKTHQRALGEHGGYYGGHITVDPHDANTVYITGVILLKSQDGGKTWDEAAADDVHVDFHAVWVDPRNSNHVWVGSDGGAYYSLDGGAVFRHVNNLSVGQFTTIAVDGATPYNIYGGLQDNGTMKGPSTYVPGRSNLNAWTSIGGGDGSAVAVDPRNNGVVYVASQFGAHQAVDLVNNRRWNARPPNQPGDTPLRFNWVSPILVSPHHPDIIYVGANRLFRSLDQGRKWEAISPDLTKQRPNGDVPFSTIKDVSESPFKFGLIYVGCDDGNVKMTKDHGNTWIDIPTPQPNKWVSRILASKWDASTVYVAQSGYREDDFGPYLWKSIDYGKTWTSISQGLPTETINVIREDPIRKGLLYVGTDLGVFISFDDGKNWTPFGHGLPRTPVHDLVIHPTANEIVIASHARSVWVADVKPLQEFKPENLQKDAFIVEPDNMFAAKSWGYGARGPWDSKDPRSPVLKFQCWTKVGGKGKIRLIDKDGKPAIEKDFDFYKGFTSASVDLQIAPGKPFTVDPKQNRPKTGKDAIQDPYLAERPKYLAPGAYMLEIEVGGVKASTKWSLNGD